MKHKQALTKFLRCVKWNRPQERACAIQLLEDWTPIDVADALQLLSRDFEEPTGEALTFREVLLPENLNEMPFYSSLKYISPEHVSS